jgi:hypothetical protein
MQFLFPAHWLVIHGAFFHQNAEEEKLAMEGQYKKMRKFVRNSVLGASSSGKEAPVDQTAAAVLGLSSLSTDMNSPGPPTSTPPLPPPPFPVGTPRVTLHEREIPEGNGNNVGLRNECAPSELISGGSGTENAAAARTSAKSDSTIASTPGIPSENDAGNGTESVGKNALLSAIVNRAKLKKVESD